VRRAFRNRGGIGSPDIQTTGSYRRPRGSCRMLDLILIALGLGFFALSIAYVYACDRL
jgi:hypothetical protein